MPSDIVAKLKASGLVGRGGACFPTWLKWQTVKGAKGDKKYVVANGSEGEPGVKKDGYILEHHLKEFIAGLKIASDFLPAERAYIYLNHEYFKKYQKSLVRQANSQNIEIVKKTGSAGYIGGEETSVLNGLEGRRIEPRLRPPWPTTHGLWGMPTLINNIETFYEVALVSAGCYEHKRFYTIGGDCLWEGIYEFPENWTIERIIKETGNYPEFEFFVQVGGDASGEIMNSQQLDRPVAGSGTITIYSLNKHEPLDLIRRWVNFFQSESCGQCTPCREGTYRLKEILSAPEPDWELFSRILDNLRDTSFCGLGCAVSVPIFSYAANVLNEMPANKIKLPAGFRHTFCDCLN